MTDNLPALFTLWRMVQAVDEDTARDLRRQAIREGATAAEVARALRVRDDLVTGSVQTISARFDERYDPSPEPIVRRVS